MTQAHARTARRIGVMICSTRKPRVCPQIARFVIDTIESTRARSRTSKVTIAINGNLTNGYRSGCQADVEVVAPAQAQAQDEIEAEVQAEEAEAVAASLHVIDLDHWNLPMYNESAVPSTIFDPSSYEHEHTRRWSAEISSYDAIIFVTPQYNWGYPASLKNAIDYLYNEWKGKPAMIVTYGGHGGGKCGAQLRQVLSGVGMVTTSRNVELSFGSKGKTIYAASGNDLELDGVNGTGLWGGLEREEIIELYRDLIALLE
ncbi:hypothetical protein IAT40_007828 [Kwoniella sp. CBS 6097]